VQVSEFNPVDYGYPYNIKGTPTETHSPRSTGTLHLSTIYRDMEQTAAKQREPDLTEEELSWYAAGGLLWERVFSIAYCDAMVENGGPDLVRPDEWTLDGITGSPDAIRLSTWRVVELKCRWMSANKLDNLEKYFFWELVQIKGYCKMVGATSAELWIFFVNGDYRPPRPIARGLLLEFTEQEIEESWLMVVMHAKRKGWL
jgi:hypothetical protein